MKSKRHRAILKAKGYSKHGNLYFKPTPCFKCKGEGKIYENGHGKDIECPPCEGTGELFDVTSIDHEKYWDKHRVVDVKNFFKCLDK